MQMSESQERRQQAWSCWPTNSVVAAVSASRWPSVRSLGHCRRRPSRLLRLPSHGVCQAQLENDLALRRALRRFVTRSVAATWQCRRPSVPSGLASLQCGQRPGASASKPILPLAGSHWPRQDGPPRSGTLGSNMVSFTPARSRSPATRPGGTALVTDGGGAWRTAVSTVGKRVWGNPSGVRISYPRPRRPGMMFDRLLGRSVVHHA